MSPLLWLQRLFVPKSDEEDSTEQVEMEPSPFEMNQHIRIIIALLVVLIAAGVLWWILM